MRAEREPPEIDEDTFRRFRAGEEQAALAIVEAFHRRILAFLRVQTNDPDMAEDMAQETFLRMLRHRQRLTSPARLPSWLFTVAARLSHRERQKRNRPLPETHLREPAQTPNPTGELLQRQRDKILLRAIGHLAEGDRQLVNLRYFGGLSIRQLSETLNIPMGSVGVKLSRAQQRLRRWLEGNGYRPEDLL